MIKTIQALIDDSDLEAFIEGSSEERAAVVQGVFESLEESEIRELLAYFCTGDRESYNEDPTVARICMDDDMNGTIDVDFTGSAYYGCKDMDRLDEHSEAVRFEVSVEASQVTFTTESPDPPERPPDEEF
jgi:hypothetical protein